VDIVWILAGFAFAVLVSVIVLSCTRAGRTISFWPWVDTTGGDRRLDTYVAEEEVKRAASQQRDRDLAP
jgi:hypothetical protein